MENTALTMGSSLHDIVLDFDLNFLRQTTNTTSEQSRIEKQRKAICLAKQKIIATNSLIHKYHAKKEMLEEVERLLTMSKEECKKICIDYKNVLERCELLQKEYERLRTENNDLQERSFAKDNQQAADKSYVNQLQLLVNDRDAIIQSLQKENQILKANAKDSEKKSFKKDNNLVKSLSNIADLVFLKKSLHKKDKMFLFKYLKNASKAKELLSDGENSSCEQDIFDDDDVSSAVDNEDLVESTTKKDLSSVEVRIEKEELIIKSHDKADHDSEIFSEAVSLDTGRGSSLAFSDSDKCVASPDYFLDSPVSGDMIVRSKKQADSSTSPITVRRVVERATSPFIFDAHIEDASEISIKDQTNKVRKPVANKESIPKLSVEKSIQTTSTLSFEANFSDYQYARNKLRENIIANENHKEFAREQECLKNTEDNQHCANKLNGNVIGSECKNKLTRERECLQQQNNLDIDNENDPEVKAILGSMGMTIELLTPIPPTPTSSVISRSRSTIINDENGELIEKVEKMEKNYSHIIKKLTSMQDILIKHITEKNNCGGSTTHINESETSLTAADNGFYKSTLGCTSDILADLPDDESDTDIIIIRQDEEHHSKERKAVHQKSKKNGQDNNAKQFNSRLNPRISISPLPVSSLITFEQDQIEEIDPEENTVNIKDSSTELTNSGKKKKIKKISRLEKMRKNILPKSKIRKIDQPVSRKLRARLNKFPIIDEKSKNLKPGISLNYGEAYEKAVKVMSEIRSKQEAEAAKTPKVFKKSSARTNVQTRFGTENSNNKSDKLEVEEKKLRRGRMTRFPNAKSDTETKHQNTEVHKNIQEAKAANEEKPYDEVGMHSKRLLSDKSVMEIEKPRKDTCKRTDKESEQVSEITSCNMIRRRSRRLSSDKSFADIETQSQDTRKRIEEEYEQENEITSCNMIRTRSKRLSSEKSLIELIDLGVTQGIEVDSDHIYEEKSLNKMRKRSKRLLSRDNPDLMPTRVLRSSLRIDNSSKTYNTNVSEKTNEIDDKVENHINSRISSTNLNALGELDSTHNLISYQDIELFADDESPMKKKKCLENKPGIIENPEDSVLCKMIEKYGITAIKNSPKKIPDTVVISISKKLEAGIAHINEVPSTETKKVMNDLVEDLQKYKMKEFISGLMIYLQDPQRKIEWYNKANIPPAPPMTKSEQVLLYIVTRLNWPEVDIIPCILNQIEHTLFRLNSSPDFRVIETMAHFYAILCSYIKAKSRLRLFILDSMYCLNYKCIPLVRQCIEVWMHILPLSHMGTAKNPLVISLVYLLFFFKCEDKFNRVHEMRNILTKKYFFKINEWNESRILEMLKNAIKEVNDNPMERKMLRLALILVAKRHGARWCQVKLIQNILQPLIMQEDVPERIKIFSVSMLGPLVKPYPADMKVHCEIIMNQLTDMLDQNLSIRMRESIFSSLMTMSRHNSNRVVQALLAWHPTRISAEFEAEIKEFVRGRPLRAWQGYLSKIPLIQ